MFDTNAYSVTGFVGVPNRINVALSRHTNSLLIISDTETMGQNSHWGRVQKEIIDEGLFSNGMIDRLNDHWWVTYKYFPGNLIENLEEWLKTYPLELRAVWYTITQEEKLLPHLAVSLRFNLLCIEVEY